MEILQIHSLSKSFGSTAVLKGVDFSVQEGEIFFVLGPSGCGKTTLLRIITGFAEPDRGKVFLSGRDITGYPPARRNIGMVFQNYALWPHMKVWQNISYGLEVKQLPVEIIRKKTEEVLEITKLGPFRDKFPAQLSGGQQQRVALARAIVTAPKVLLLDEPLSNLDAKLREDMRSEIRRVQRETRITMIYVTHDQKEAMSLGERITVMNDGFIIQTGRPAELYSSPLNEFVATFLGDMNFFQGEVVSCEGLCEVRTGEGIFKAAVKNGIKKGDSVKIGFRPENAVLFPAGDVNETCGRVKSVEYLGETSKIAVVTEQGNVFQLKAFSGEAEKISPESPLKFSVSPENLVIFQKQ